MRPDTDQEDADLEGELLNQFLTKLLTSDTPLDTDFKTIILDFLEHCSTKELILD